MESTEVCCPANGESDIFIGVGLFAFVCLLITLLKNGPMDFDGIFRIGRQWYKKYK